MLEITTDGPVATLRMAHGKASALDLDFLRALRAALARLAADDSVRALVLTGSGSIFSAGVDLRKLLAGGRPYIEQFLPELDGCVLELFAWPGPVVAAVNGHAIAGGCVLACACDTRLLAAGEPLTGRAAPRLGMPELTVGVPFPASVIEVLRAAVPAPTLDQLVLRARLLGPDEALAMGLVHALVAPAELPARAQAVALELAGVPAVSYAETKRLLRAPALQRARTEGAARAAWLLDAWASNDVLGAVRRYVEATLGAR